MTIYEEFRKNRSDTIINDHENILCKAEIATSAIIPYYLSEEKSLTLEKNEENLYVIYEKDSAKEDEEVQIFSTPFALGAFEEFLRQTEKLLNEDAVQIEDTLKSNGLDSTIETNFESRQADFLEDMPEEQTYQNSKNLYLFLQTLQENQNTLHVSGDFKKITIQKKENGKTNPTLHIERKGQLYSSSLSEHHAQKRMLTPQEIQKALQQVFPDARHLHRVIPEDSKKPKAPERDSKKEKVLER